MTEMVHGAVPAGQGEPILPRWWRSVDKVSILCVFALFAIGILLGLAASPPLAERNGLAAFYYVERQLIFGAVALSTMLSFTLLTPHQVRRFGVLGFVLAFVALALLPVFGTDFGKGAVRWYSLGFGSFQPSEFLKPGFVVLCAWLLAAAQEVAGPPGRVWSFAIASSIAALLALQPDFGQAVLFLFGWGVMYFVGGAPLTLLIVIGAGAVGAGVFAYGSSDHFARRIDGFLSPEIDPRTQIGYATNAIQEGGFFGVGVGEGQVKRSLPDAHTDFIIAVAAEEYGLILVLLILFLYIVVSTRSLTRLMRERDPFARLAGTGLVCIFAVQALINTGVAVRLLPAKGMTLPFVSYGGSSVIAAGIMAGFLFALTRARPQGLLNDHLIRQGR